MKSKEIGVIVIILCLITLGIVVPVSASAPLTITGGNQYVLNGYSGLAYHNGGYLYWSFGQNLAATHKRGCGSDTQFADNNGNYWGECVSAVKALSGSNVVTYNWARGSQVTSGGVSQGTVIATFPNGQYPQDGTGHAAILKSYVYSGSTIVGIQVWDQNWPIDGSTTGLFGTHTLSTSGSGNGDADNYYVVMV